MAVIRIESPAFEHGKTIPRRHTGDGADASPALKWSGVPAEARELALIVDDPDAPTPQPWVHWLLYRVPPDARELPEGIPPAERVPVPSGAVQGRNSFGRIGYGGPAPPRGHGVHRYRFRLYALDTPLSLEPGLTRDRLEAAMKDHVLAQGELVGSYQR